MKVIGYVASNETGIHTFCVPCVKPDEKQFGTLLPVYKSARKCAFCGVKLGTFTHYEITHTTPGKSHTKWTCYADGQEDAITQFNRYSRHGVLVDIRVID